MTATDRTPVSLKEIDISAPASTLGFKLWEIVKAMMPPVDGPLADKYQSVLSAVEEKLNSPQNRWLLTKQVASREDILPADCIPRLQRLLKDGADLECGNEESKDLVSRARSGVGKYLADCLGRLEVLDKTLAGEPEAVRTKAAEISAVEGFKGSEMRPLEWFEEMRGSIPPRLRAEVEQALKEFGQPQGFLYTIGLRNAEKERERLCARTLEEWIKTQRATLEYKDSKNGSLQKERDSVAEEIQKLKEGDPAIYLRILQSLTEETISAASRLTPLEAVQKLGAEYQALKLKEKKLKGALLEAAVIGDALESDGGLIVSTHKSFCETAVNMEKDEYTRLKAAVKQTELEMANCCSAVELDKLTTRLKEERNQLKKEESPRIASERVLESVVDEYAEALFREAKKQLLSEQTVTKEAVFAVRNSCEALMPGIIGPKCGDSIRAIVEGNAKALARLKAACHQGVCRWLDEDAAVLLRRFVEKDSQIRFPPRFWRDMVRELEKPVIIDLNELQRRSSAGQKSILFTTKISGDRLEGKAWPEGTKGSMLGSGNIPDTFLFPLLYVNHNRGFEINLWYGDGDHQLWLPLNEAVDKTAMTAALEAFRESCELPKNSIGFQFKYEFRP